VCVELYQWLIELERTFILPLAPRWVRHFYFSKRLHTIPYTCGTSLASIALAPNNALQQFMEDHESDVFRKEREEIDDIFLHQQPLIKHNLPMEDLGTTLPP
jgi:hypothetical protein